VKPLKPTRFEDWMAKCNEYLNQDQENRRNKVLKQIFRKTPFGYRFTWYFKDYGIDITESQKAQRVLGIQCPKLDENLFNNIFHYILNKT